MKKGPSDCGEPLSEALFSLAGFDLLGSTPRLHTARSTSLLLTRYGLGPGASNSSNCSRRPRDRPVGVEPSAGSGSVGVPPGVAPENDRSFGRGGKIHPVERGVNRDFFRSRQTRLPASRRQLRRFHMPLST